MVFSSLVKPYRWRLLLTLTLIIIESLLGILFPLFIGEAIESMLKKDVSGIMQLGVLGALVVIIGGIRRLYDSRFYAKVYTKMGGEIVNRMRQQNNSIKAARLNMLAEMVKFAENQFPDIIQHSIGLIGVMIIIAFLNVNIFFGTIIAGVLVVGIYFLSSNKTFQYNSQFNNEMEAQVTIIASNRQSGLKNHLLKLMKWNIKLSDIETINYSASWILMILLLMASISLSVSSGVVQYGALFALIMYVYQYIESLVSLPLYYQQWLRLREIAQRIQEI